MKYIAQNIEDIAAMFDVFAARERKWNKDTRTATARRESEITARVWEQAAGIVRDTTITPEGGK